MGETTAVAPAMTCFCICLAFVGIIVCAAIPFNPPADARRGETDNGPKNASIGIFSAVFVLELLKLCVVLRGHESAFFAVAVINLLICTMPPAIAHSNRPVCSRWGHFPAALFAERVPVPRNFFVHCRRARITWLLLR
jgi:hypothetical protein